MDQKISKLAQEYRRLAVEILKEAIRIPADYVDRPLEEGGDPDCGLSNHEGPRLEYLRKKTQKPELIPSSGVIAAIKSRALGLFLRLPFKVSAPARTAEVAESAELQDLERDWAEVQSAWRDFLEDFPTELAGKAVYKHPVAGRLNLEQTLRFLIDHLRRHTRQIERALAEGLAP